MSAGTELRRFDLPGDEIMSVAFSPDGSTLAAGGRRGFLYVWDVRSGRRLRAVKSHQESVNGVAFSPDGQLLASACGVAFATTGSDSPDDTTVKFWDVKTGQLIRTLTGHTGRGVSSIAFGPGGRVLVSGGEDGMLIIWNVATGRAVRKVPVSGRAYGDVHVAYSPDGKTIAAEVNDGIILLDTAGNQGAKLDPGKYSRW